MTSAPIDKINLAEKARAIPDHWNPRVLSELNGQHVKLVKLSGEFVWHSHEHEDELFLVVSGGFRMELRDPQPRSVNVEPGELIVIPRGVEHRPVADQCEAVVLLFEPASTVNTGEVLDDPRRRTVLEHI